MELRTTQTNSAQTQRADSPRDQGPTPRNLSTPLSGHGGSHRAAALARTDLEHTPSTIPLPPFKGKKSTLSIVNRRDSFHEKSKTPRSAPGRRDLRGAVAATVLCLLALAGCRATPPEATGPQRFEFFAMGGIPVHVSVWGHSSEAASRGVESYRNEVQRLEALFSTYRANSAITRANRAAGETVRVDPDTARAVSDALRLATESGGAFDPTVGPLVRLWKTAAARGAPPTPTELAGTLTVVGHQRVRLDERDGAAWLTLPAGGALDLGGVAKGFFGDVGARMLRENGVQRGLVELGGDLVAFDDRPRPEPFRVGVRHPRQRGAMLGVLSLPGGAVVTSGDYERSFEIAGKRYNHIFDPRTGEPCEGVLSVTVVAENGARADALATGVLVMGATEGPAFVERSEGVEAIIVVEDAGAPDGFRIHVSAGLKERFERLP